MPEIWLRYLGRQAAQASWARLDGQRWSMAYPQDGQYVLALPRQEGTSLFYADARMSKSIEMPCDSCKRPTLNTVQRDAYSTLSEQLAVSWTLGLLLPWIGSQAS